MTRSSKSPWLVAAALLLSACASKTPVVKPDRPVTDTGSEAAPASTAAAPAKDPATQFEESLALLKGKKFKEARAGFESLAKEHPEFSGPLTNLAILDAKANTREAAITNFNRAINANPRNAIAYNWLGILYRETKNYPRAEQSYLKALELNPDSPAVVLNLAILYDLYLKRPVDALARYQDYQRMTNNRELKVTAWIKALEASLPPPAPTTAPGTPTPVTPKT